jgi:hypothetical protein
VFPLPHRQAGASANEPNQPAPRDIEGRPRLRFSDEPGLPAKLGPASPVLLEEGPRLRSGRVARVDAAQIEKMEGALLLLGQMIWSHGCRSPPSFVAAHHS